MSKDHILIQSDDILRASNWTKFGNPYPSALRIFSHNALLSVEQKHDATVGRHKTKMNEENTYAITWIPGQRYLFPHQQRGI